MEPITALLIALFISEVHTKLLNEDFNVKTPCIPQKMRQIGGQRVKGVLKSEAPQALLWLESFLLTGLLSLMYPDKIRIMKLLTGR